MLSVRRFSLTLPRIIHKACPLALARTQDWSVRCPQPRYFFSTSDQISSHPEMHSNSQNIKDKGQFLALEELIPSMKQDLGNNFINYSSIQKSFAYHLQHQHFNSKNTDLLLQCLNLISQYPYFHLTNAHILTIYKLSCHNMHLKSVQTMNQLLLFSLSADPQVSQSPIYHEFIKFYLLVTAEEYKVKFQVDFDQLSLWEAIKQLLGRITQRGFFSRTPPYSRLLNVLESHLILYKLAARKDTRDALMIKKLNYTIFLGIKHFYQQEMKENLYHWKKVLLLGQFTEQYMQVLSMELPQTYNQNIHLRELYMKLYLTLPEDNIILDSLGNNKLQKSEIALLKIKNVVYLYELAVKHVKRIDHLKLEQVEQNIGVVIQFIQKVQLNFKQVCLEQVDIGRLSIKESLHLMSVLIGLEEHQSSFYRKLQEKIISSVKYYQFKCLFNEVLSLLQKTSKIHQFHSLLNSSQFSLLDLLELNSLSKLITDTIPQNRQIFTLLLGSILQRLLSIDYESIKGEEICIFIEVYQKYLFLGQYVQNQPQITAKSQTLRVFVLRYLADHHKQLSLQQLKQVLSRLLDLPPDSLQNYDDAEGNYPLSILEQMHPYTSKIDLLLPDQIRQKLATSNGVRQEKKVKNP